MLGVYYDRCHTLCPHSALALRYSDKHRLRQINAVNFQRIRATKSKRFVGPALLGHSPSYRPLHLLWTHLFANKAEHRQRDRYVQWRI